MPIGETLAEARQRAGLTVAQLSEQTRIREAVIEGIEGDDYSACGGDFYARANIRSIAKAVRADPGPLIAEYDALYRARGALSAVSLEELLAASVPGAPRHRPGPPAAGAPMAAGYAAARRQAGPQVAREPAVPGYRPAGRWLSWAVVLGLVMVIGFGVYSRFSGPRQAAAAPPAAGKHAVTHQQPGPGTPVPAPTVTHGAVAPAPAPTVTHGAVAPGPAAAVTHVAMAPAPAAAAAARTPTPARAAAPGPGGGNPPPTHRVTAGNRPASPAHQQPLPEPVLKPGPAPGQKQPGHRHGHPDHHRPRTRAVQQAAGPSAQQRPGAGAMG